MPAVSTAVAADVVLFTVTGNLLEVLLVRPHRGPFHGAWALPGGPIRRDESLEEAARRVLCQQTGVRDVYLEQLYTFGEPARDPRGRVVSVAYYALVRREAMRLPGSRERDVALFPARRPPPLAFDHARIVATAVRRLQAKLTYSTVGVQLLPPHFTLGELQRLYEVILRRRLDKRNFRRKVLARGLLRPEGARRPNGRGRPARLYSFRTQRIMFLDGQIV